MFSRSYNEAKIVYLKIVENKIERPEMRGGVRRRDRFFMGNLFQDRLRRNKLFRYLENDRKVHRKVSRGFEKFSAKRVDVLSEYANPILSFISFSFFEMKVFSKTSKIFSLDFTNMLDVFETFT